MSSHVRNVTLGFNSVYLHLLVKGAHTNSNPKFIITTLALVKAFKNMFCLILATFPSSQGIMDLTSSVVSPEKEALKREYKVGASTHTHPHTRAQQKLQ